MHPQLWLVFIRQVIRDSHSGNWIVRDIACFIAASYMCDDQSAVVFILVCCHVLIDDLTTDQTKHAADGSLLM